MNLGWKSHKKNKGACIKFVVFLRWTDIWVIFLSHYIDKDIEFQTYVIT